MNSFLILKDSESQTQKYERYLDDLLSSEITKTIDNLTELVLNTKRSLNTLNMKDELDLFPIATPYAPISHSIQKRVTKSTELKSRQQAALKSY